MGETLQHLILVRHGESEGDVRRAAWRRGDRYVSAKRPEDEELTALGAEQSRRAGLWIVEHILGKYALKYFDGYFVSLSCRSLQSAVAMELGDMIWQGDERLNERNRGRIRGLRSEQHRKLFPGSYEKMQSDPIHWIPPGGESMLDVTDRWSSFYDDIQNLRSAIVVGHRDQMWAAMQPLEQMSDEELLAVDTETIHNAQVIHYTSLDPETGQAMPTLMWKRSIDPTDPESSTGWQQIPNVPVVSA